jgi:GT2 family glycosyltransferase
MLTARGKLLSIIILTYDRNEDLTVLLTSISNQSGVDFDRVEVLVLDNSRESLAGAVIPRFKDALDISYVENKENLGTSKARNKGVKLSRGEYVLFLDDDNILQEGTILSAVFKDADYMDRSPHVGAIKYINDIPLYENGVFK